MHDERTEPKIICPSCRKMTKKIIVEVSRIDWASILLIGVAAALFPSMARKELQCEHCGKVFPTPPPQSEKSDRLIGYVLAGFSLLMVGLVILIVFFGMKDPSR